MKDIISATALGLIGVLGFVAFLALLALLNGWAIATLWGWFVVPLGMKVISFAHAYGLSLLISVTMSTRGIQNNGDSKATIAKGIMLPIMLPIMAVLFGWIAVQFI